MNFRYSNDGFAPTFRALAPLLQLFKVRVFSLPPNWSSTWFLNEFEASVRLQFPIPAQNSPISWSRRPLSPANCSSFLRSIRRRRPGISAPSKATPPLATVAATRKVASRPSRRSTPSSLPRCARRPRGSRSSRGGPRRRWRWPTQTNSESCPETWPPFFSLSLPRRGFV